MMPVDRHKPIRRAVTLIELLIVVSIIILLAAIALPAMQTGMEDRRTREAARAFHVYLGSAQVRAARLGRPVGVLLERSTADPRSCTLVRQVEVPAPYAGDFDGTAVILQDWTNLPNQTIPHPSEYMPGFHVVKAVISAGSLSNGMVRYGDRVRLNHGGPLYTIERDLYEQPDVDFPTDADGYIMFSSGGALTLTVPNTEVYNVPWPDVPIGAWPPSVDTSTPPWSAATPFHIILNPVPSAVAPLTLPRGMVIDLDDSGYNYVASDLGPPPATPDPYPSMAKDEFAARDWVYGDPTSGKSDPLWGLDKAPRPVLVMFNPDGSVEQVYHTSFALVGGAKVRTYGSRLVHSSIFFMIGRANRTGDVNDTVYVTPTPEDELENWQDASNLWLALNPQTGQMNVAEVYADALNPATNTYTPSSLLASRALARQAQVSMRGR